MNAHSYGEIPRNEVENVVPKHMNKTKSIYKSLFLVWAASCHALGTIHNAPASKMAARIINCRIVDGNVLRSIF